MNILVACDSFKDALSAEGVCRAIAAGLKKSRPDAEIVELPLSDGGEGLLDILSRPLSLEMMTVEAGDPLGRPIRGRYGLSSDRAIAVVEMAEVSGLQRLTLAERDPLKTSTYGTGQLLADARARGARHAVLAIGGSATNDAGVGAAAALGWRFLDSQGKDVPPVGGRLADIAAVIPPGEPVFAQVDVLCDVTNPLYGPTGAAWTYGRQKGGNDETIAFLDAGLRHIADVIERTLGRSRLADTPGAGSAGGLGFGALAFLGGQLKRGISTVLDLVGFDRAVAEAHLIITGEGHIDHQSLHGKLIQGVCDRAAGVPVIALCGKLSASAEEIRAVGLKAAYCINDTERPLAEMLAATAANLERKASGLPV